MKNRKRILAVIISAVMVLLPGCADNGAIENTGGSEETEIAESSRELESIEDAQTGGEEESEPEEEGTAEVSEASEEGTQSAEVQEDQEELQDEDEEEFGVFWEHGLREIETDNYAIYCYTLKETGRTVFGLGEVNVNFWYPQLFYYADAYEEFGREFEEQINQMLFDEGAGYSETKGSRSYFGGAYDYEITMAEDQLISIKYFSYFIGAVTDSFWVSGCTFNPLTGGRMKLTDYITVDETLCERVRDGILNGEIECVTSILQNEVGVEYLESIMRDLEWSVDFWTDLPEYERSLEYSFYLSEDTINVVIGMNFNYVLKIPYGKY